MFDTVLIQKKLQELVSYLDEMDKVIGFSVQEIITDSLKLRSLERLFQLIVDTALAINTHIIRSEQLEPSEDYQSTFTILSKNKFLPLQLANRIAPSVGLRNLVVHKYGKVDLKKMVHDVKNEIGQYRKFAAAILKLL